MSSDVMRYVGKIMLLSKIKGGALYYAIFIMMILGLISFLLLSYFELTNREDTIFYKTTELEDNIESAVTLISANPELLPIQGDVELDIFNNGEALVSIEVSRWGMLRRVVFNAGWKHVSLQKVLLMAEKEESRPALWMPERNRYISLVGKSKILGDAYISKLGMRRGNIEGRYFEGAELHDGRLFTGDVEIPQLKKELLTWITNYHAGDVSAGDSLVSFSSGITNSNLRQSFLNNTIVLQASGKIVLDKGSYSDNILIYTSDTIEVWPTIRLNEVILMADVIIFKQECEVQLQAFASKSLIVEDDCSFKYPSFIGTVGLQDTVLVDIGKGCSVNGGIICYSTKSQEGATYLSVDKGCEVTGTVYTNGDANVSTNIIGSLYCNRFVHRTPRAFYENFLIDCIIDEVSLPDEYASFSITDKISNLKVVRQCH